MTQFSLQRRVKRIPTANIVCSNNSAHECFVLQSNRKELKIPQIYHLLLSHYTKRTTSIYHSK